MPLLLAWLLWAGRREAGLRRAAGRAALVALGCGLVLLPWTLHHAARHGRLVVVSSVGPYNLLVGSDPSAHFVDKDDHWNARWGHLPEGGYAQGPALQVSWLRIVSRPGGFLAKSLWEAGHLWTLDSFPLRHLRNGWYGDAAAAWLPGAVVLCVAFTALLYAGGVLGLLAAPASSLRSVGLLALLHATLLFGVTFSLSRYAVPMRPLLALGAAWLAWHPRGPARWLRRDGRLDARRAVLAAGVVLLLGFAWWNDLPLLWDMLAHGGRDHRFRWLE